MQPALALAERSDRRFFAFNATLSAAALCFLGYLLLVRRGGEGAGVDLRFLPAVNASLNALAASFLVAGYLAIRRGARKAHQYLMVSAFAASALFLFCYLTYHYVHGDTRFAGTGPIRTVYFFVLATHVLFSMAVVPLALTALYFAWRGRLERHRKVAKLLLPIWLYVSATGVLIFALLRSHSG
ncbi:MAG: DUF420 domain-containing protein [Myxococcales bacterium]|nr:DUF420 domain-containing protein [Myxococcales bacterium]